MLQLAIDDEDVGFRYADLPLLSAPQQIEVRWRTSSGGGANDGFLCARRIDREGTSPPGGEPEVCIPNVDTDAKTEGRIVFGSVVILDSSVSGELYLDGFESYLP